MGNEVSRARVLTVSSFLTNFAVQTYGMVTTPNMKDIAEANHFAFSPNPWFIAAFFSGQVVLQLAWIRKLFENDVPEGYQPIGSGASDVAAKQKQKEWQIALSYAPVYALGNFCIAGWLFFWLREDFKASQVLVTINTLAQLLAVAALPPLTPNSSSLMRLTHYVAKTFAGIGVLDLVDNGGVALVTISCSTNPSGASRNIRVLPLAAAASKPLFGSVLLYDIIAIAVGQSGVLGAGAWPTRLGWTALATAGVVGVKAVPTLKEHFSK